MPAYNAARTLRQTYEELPFDIVDEVLLVDDSSSDETVDLARELNVTTFQHKRNLGYGRNQKTCYSVTNCRSTTPDSGRSPVACSSRCHSRKTATTFCLITKCWLRPFTSIIRSARYRARQSILRKHPRSVSSGA